MRSDLQTGGFSVYTTSADGFNHRVCHDVSAREAANELWRCTHNMSARTGITERALIVDAMDRTVLEWIPGRGYTYDGVHYTPSPAMENEVH